MIDLAKVQYKLNLKESILVGDKMSDIEAGQSAKIGHLILFNEFSNSKPLKSNFSTIDKLITMLELPIW